MSRSTDPGHFFQTTSALEAAQRKSAKSKNKHGDPIVLPSKILAVIPDSTPGGEGCVFLAESAGTARRVDVRAGGKLMNHKETTVEPPPKTTRKIYRGPTAPLTSVAISPDSTTLFAGCWDKSIWSWDIETGQPKRKYIGHSDFVKSVLCAVLASTPADSDGPAENGSQTSAKSLELLISGSSDSSIIIWSIASGQKLHTIRGGERASGILDLAIDPSSLIYPQTPPAASQPAPNPTSQSQLQPQCHPESFTLFASSSDPLIRRWTVAASAPTSSSAEGIKVAEAGPDIHVHETSINQLVFAHVPDDDDDDDAAAADGNDPLPAHLFTASSDNTAKHLTRRRPIQIQAQPPTQKDDPPSFTTKTTYPHPDFVRAVAVAVATTSTSSPHGNQIHVLATACRDEEIRIFDLQSGQLVRTLSGHYEEVTGLALVGDGGAGDVLVSVGIDGTVRRWGLEGEGGGEGAEGSGTLGSGEDDAGMVGGKEEEGESMMTAEEEAELAELMESG